MGEGAGVFTELPGCGAATNALRQESATIWGLWVGLGGTCMGCCCGRPGMWRGLPRSRGACGWCQVSPAGAAGYRPGCGAASDALRQGAAPVWLGLGGISGCRHAHSGRQGVMQGLCRS